MQRREGERGPGAAEHVLEPHLDRKLLVSAEEHEGQEEVVPVRDEAEEEDERDDRLRQRECRCGGTPPLAAPVDPRGVEQVGGEGGRVVEVGEVDAEREEGERQDDREGLPTRCTAFSSRKIGSTSVAGGMIIATSVSVRISLRPRKLPKASPYPAGIPVASTIAVALSE